MARGGVRNPFTEREDAHLVEYIAKVKPAPAGRLGNKHFEALEDDDAFPWAKYHPWQSWRERYKKNQEEFDRKIRRFQKANAQKEKRKVIESDEEGEEDKQEGSSTRAAATKPVAQVGKAEDNVKEGRRGKDETLPQKTNERSFAGDDDKHLVQYIAESKASIQARQGYSLYRTLEENKDNLWPWAKRHTWQAWRQRYMNHQQPMNESILRLQKRSRQRAEATKAAQPGKEPDANVEDKSTHVEASQKIQRAPEKVKRAGSATVDPLPKAKPVEAQRQPFHMVRDEIQKQNPSAQLHVAANVVQPERVQYRTDDRTAFQRTGATNLLSEAPRTNHVDVEANHNQPRQPSMPPIKTLVDDEEVADSHEEEDSPVYEEHDTMLELFGPDIDELDEDENGVVEETPPPRPREVVAPQVSQEPTPPKSEVKNVEHAPSPDISHSARHAAAKKLKPKRRSQADEDFFRSSSSPPPVAKNAVTTTRGNPPVYVEGAFRTTLKRVRSREDEVETAWPPKRLKKNPVSADKDTMLVDNPDKEIDVMKKESPKTMMQQPPKPNGAVARPPQGRQVNAVASSSKVKLPDSPRQEKQRPISPPRVTKRRSPVIPQAQAPTAARQLAPPSKKDVPLVVAEMSRVAPIAKTNQTKAVPAALVVSPSRPNQPISPGNVSDGDVFRVSGQSLSEKARGKARAEYVLDTRPPRIDLHRQSLQRRMNTSVSISTTKHSTSSSRTSSVSASSRRIGRARQSILGVVLPAESVTALAEQMLSIVTNIAQKYSVSDDVALATFLHTGSLEKTQAVLMGREYGMTDEDSLAIFLKVKTLEKTQVVLMGYFYGIEEKTALNSFKKWRTLERTQVALERYNKAMFEADAAMTKEMPEWVDNASGDEDGDSEDAPSGLVPREILAAKERRNSGGSSKRNSRSSRGRKSLTIRPLPDDEDDDRLSDYAPPSQSRAGQFARLVRQGRAEEAKERERQRLSIPLAQPRRQLSMTVSPTPHSRIQSQSQMLDSQMDVEMADTNGHDVNGVNVEEEGSIMDGDVDDDANEVMEEEEVEVEEVEEVEIEKPAAAIPEEEEEQGTVVVPEEEESYGNDMMQVENPEEHQIVEEDDDDDIYMPDVPYPGQQQAENKRQDQRQESVSVSSMSPPRSPEREQSPSVVSSPTPPPRSPPTLLDRVSGGKAKDARFLALAEEHRNLALEVDVDNKQKLRAFEAKNNPDLLRLWSIKWAKEMMENYHERVAEQPEIIEISD